MLVCLACLRLSWPHRTDRLQMATIRAFWLLYCPSAPWQWSTFSSPALNFNFGTGCLNTRQWVQEPDMYPKNTRQEICSSTARKSRENQRAQRLFSLLSMGDYQSCLMNLSVGREKRVHVLLHIRCALWHLSALQTSQPCLSVANYGSEIAPPWFWKT